MLVVKFGGSILKSADGVKAACDEVNALPRPLLVVISAFEDVTNRLEKLGITALENSTLALELVEELFDDHRKIARETLKSEKNKRWQALAGDWQKKVARIVEGLSIVGELSPRTLDLIVHFGERLSSSLVAAYLNATYISATDLIITNETHRFARVDLELSRERIDKKLRPLLQNSLIHYYGEQKTESRQPNLVVTEGYIARGRHGEVTTMGRESSDFSATVFGEFLNASEVRIYTGVPGIMTADPSLVEDAKTIPGMSYSMAREIAVLGAKVIHPRTVRPVEGAGIPLVFNDLHGARTVIDANEAHQAYSITALPNASLLSIKTVLPDTDLSMLLEKLNTIPVIRSVRSGRTFYVLTPFPDPQIDRLLHDGELQTLIQEFQTNRFGLVAYVRQRGLRSSDGLDFLSALAEESIEMLWNDPSERSICALVQQNRLTDIVQALHRQFSPDS